MLYHLSRAVAQGRFVAGSEKATIAHLPAESFRQYRFTFPPYEEQQALAEALDSATGKLEELQGKAHQQVELLQERRVALISAAVTGKIDLRSWVCSESRGTVEVA